MAGAWKGSESLPTSCCFPRELTWPRSAIRFFRARRRLSESSSIPIKLARCSRPIGRASKEDTQPGNDNGSLEIDAPLKFAFQQNANQTNHHEIRRHVRRGQRNLSQRGADCELGISGAHRGRGL